MINLYLDGELSKEEEVHFLNEANDNPELFQRINSERNLRNLIRDHALKPTVSKDLIQRIKQNISYPSNRL
jgi:hypothetical protein